MKQITEDMKLQEEWYKQAKSMTIDKLPKFVEELTSNYKHDYGTVCHAVAACGLAAMHAVNASACGGISGFQAGCIMWEFIKNWNGNEGPMRLVNYEDMLYPQHDEKFNAINKETWKFLQNRAKNLLENDSTFAHPTVIEHWKSIVDGQVPFGYSIRGE